MLEESKPWKFILLKLDKIWNEEGWEKILANEKTWLTLILQNTWW